MLKLKFLILVCVSFFVQLSYAQKVKVTGTVKDATTGEPLIGANVLYEPLKGMSTDLDGKFNFTLDKGTYEFSVTYIGYKAQKQKVTLEGSNIELDFALESNMLTEVEVIADLAKPRETPVAYSNVDAQRIQEQSGSQDLPMLLNSTPGVYATQGSGGDGAARISIRGFNSQNVLVMIDGVPMNDMFNGRVFWSNWFGLDNQTKTMQVQRGLGASKLAIPAVGGSLNIITTGIDQQKRFQIKQEVGNNLNLRTLLSASSGRLKGDWSIQGAVSYRHNDGWVDQLKSDMFFYYLRIDKIIKKHQLSITAFGAPQTSGQRDFRRPQSIINYSTEQASNLGIDPPQGSAFVFNNGGSRYNNAWGNLARTSPDEEGSGAKSRPYNTSVNSFHKPIVSLRDFIQVNNRLYVSLTAYASFGNGGGTTLAGNTVPYDSSGQLKLQQAYITNVNNIDTSTGQSLRNSTVFVRKDYNEHKWYGFLGTFEQKLSERFTLSGGLDARYYRGRVFSRVHDLLGGDVTKFAPGDLNRPNGELRSEGDIFNQNIARDILWGGVFAMVEYKSEKLSAFINVSGAITGYKQQNYFLKKQYITSDTTIDIGYYDEVTYNDEVINRDNPNLKVNSSEWIGRLGYVVKGGLNYNINRSNNVFVNVGKFSRAPYMTFLVRADNTEVRNAKNEEITSFELGYSFKSKKFSANLNGYYTLWSNRPTVTTFNIDGNTVAANANGLGARHMGVEIDLVYKIIKQLSIEAMASIGDWIWNTVATAEITDEQGLNLNTRKFDPRGIKVGDAAQHTYAVSLRAEPFKNFYFQPRINIFTHNYADFQPSALEITDLKTGYGPNIGRQSWRMPDYWFIDLSLGYGFYYKKTRFDIRGNVYNLTNNFYITDAINNNMGTGFNASSASVNVGMGTRWLTTFSVTF